MPANIQSIANSSSPENVSDLAGKTVVIVGASSGIGQATAELCVRRGARVWLASRSPERLATVRDGITSGNFPGTVEIHPVDALEESSVRALFERIGRLDHLVITAVADENSLRSPLRDMTIGVAQRGLEKFWISFLSAREAARRLNDGGSMVLTSSVSIFRPSRDGGVSVMSAASAAVAAFGRTLAAELAPIRVNVIAPGVVDTGVWSNKNSQEMNALRTWGETAIPVGHLGHPKELAEAVLFLMTNTYLTGAVIPVDGGLAIS